MPVPKLPKTTLRLSTSVTIRLIPEDTLSAAVLNNPATVLTAVQNTQLGSVERFEESNNRPADIRFEMNADAPGVVLEAFPNQVQARTITLERLVLYSSDVTETFLITGGDIVQQYKPFALVKLEVTPEGSNLPKRITVYRGCWLTSNPKAYAIRDSLKIVQSVNITYAEREVVSVP